MSFLKATEVSTACGGSASGDGISVEHAEAVGGGGLSNHGSAVTTVWGVSLQHWVKLADFLSSLTTAWILLCSFFVVWSCASAQIITQGIVGGVVEELALIFLFLVATCLGFATAVVAKPGFAFVFSTVVLKIPGLYRGGKYAGKRVPEGTLFTSRAAIVFFSFFASVFEAAVGYGTAGILSQVACGFWTSLFVYPVIVEDFGRHLGPAGVSYGAVLFSAAAMIHPSAVALCLLLVPFFLRAYTKVSTQTPSVKLHVSAGCMAVPTELVMLAGRLGVPCGDSFEQVLTWKELSALARCDSGDVGSPKVRRVAQLGDRVLAMALTQFAFTQGWDVGRESSVSQVILTNRAFARVFDTLVADLLPEMAHRSEKRKGTFVEAYVGAAYESGAVTVVGLQSFLQSTVAGAVSQDCF